ncbi:hypothetical protein GCM10023189_43190 [Nibrella saemangeumensis]|uniref:Uncharacterized protein n=1 Tax=Nibrella saemangeumensis TaxID=1084526 RepID=A0ABP8NF27_9BACT
MIRVLLDGQVVDAPMGIDRLTLKKVRHPLYWGLLYRRIGYAQGMGEVQFTDPAAVRLLHDRFERYGVQAETSYRMVTDSGRVLYDAYVDYSTYRYRAGSVSVNFRDEPVKTGLETRLTASYAITPTGSIRLTGQPISGTAQFVIGRSEVNLSAQSWQPFAHAFPLQRKSDRQQAVPGMLQNVLNPFAGDSAIYRNDTGQSVRLRITGFIRCSVRASHNITAGMGYTLTLQNGYQTSQALTTHSITTSYSEVSAALDATVDVPAGASLTVGWVGTEQVTSLSVLYQPQTELALSEPLTYPASDCPAMPVYDLFAALLSRLAPPGGPAEMSFRSDYFTKGRGKTLYITNAACLRGVLRPLTASFNSLFTGLNGMLNLGLSLEGNTLRLEPKADLLADGRITMLDEITEVEYSVNTDWLASQVKTGFKTWRGESLLSATETAGNATFSTGITTLRNELDLQSELIASGTLIEENRLKQFDPKTAGEQKADAADDALFVIDTRDGYAPAFIGGRYNEKLTPASGLAAWANLLTGCGELKLETYEGAAPTIPRLGADPLIGKYKALVRAPMPMERYEPLSDWIVFRDGDRLVRGLLLEAEWWQGASGDIAKLLIAC